MYEFIKIQYMLGNLNFDQVYQFAPKWISMEQADKIVKI